MKPKTKLHRKVLALSKKLPKITQKHRDWAYAKMFKFRMYKTQHLAVCFECGHRWNEETTLLIKINGVTCPECKKHLEYRTEKSWSWIDTQYWNMISKVGEFQVIRTFEVIHNAYKGRAAHYSCSEIYQHWFNAEMKQVCLGKDGSCGMYSYGQVNWYYGSALEVRNHDNNRYHQRISETYPRKNVLPEIKRNGFKGNFYGYSAMYFFRLLLTDRRFEILLKTKQIPTLDAYNDFKWSMEKDWRYIRICIRNKYRIPDYSMWRDYLFLLDYFKKDISNPKFICPENLREEHDRFMIMKREKLERDEAQKAEEIARVSKEMKKAKKHLFPIKFSNGSIDVVVLKTIKDFKSEEKLLNHCVYSSGYHKKATSLIMSARKNAERLETIEISLVNFNILQCRGYNNKSSEYHDEIINLVTKNIRHIKKVIKEKAINVGKFDFDDED